MLARSKQFYVGFEAREMESNRPLYALVDLSTRNNPPQPVLFMKNEFPSNNNSPQLFVIDQENDYVKCTLEKTRQVLTNCRLDMSRISGGRHVIIFEDFENFSESRDMSKRKGLVTAQIFITKATASRSIGVVQIEDNTEDLSMTINELTRQDLVRANYPRFERKVKFEHAESSNYPAFVTRVTQNPMLNGKKSAMYQWNFENSKDYRKVYGICYRVVSYGSHNDWRYTENYCKKITLQENNSNNNNNNDKPMKYETDLQCSHSSFKFVFKPETTSTMPITKVTLEQDNCRIMFDQSRQHYEISNNFNKCGGRMHEEEHNIVYSNIARVYYSNQTTSNSLISRTKSMNIKLECRLKKTQLNTLKGNQLKGNGTGSGGDGDVDGIVVGPQYIEIHDTTKSNGTFRIDFQVYKSLSYNHSYGREEFPIYLAISNRIYFEVGIDKENLHILPRTCYATKTQSYQDEPKYYLNEDSCPKDPTYAVHQQMGNKFRFSVQAFNFKDGGDSIYVHCHTYVCQNRTNEQCQFGCGSKRSRRSAEAVQEEVEGYMTSTLEIKIKGDKRITTIINDRSSNNDHHESNVDNKLLMYLQIPIAIVVFGLIFLLWKCVVKRSSTSSPPLYYEEEMKLNNNKL